MTGPDPRLIVAAKRDGASLTEEDVRRLVSGYVRGEISDALAASFLMACYVRGLDASETLALTRAMIDSGETVPLSGIAGPKVDKHSTGGVADGVTLCFAPLGAALGLSVAKLSGRGLGHTGGTLDKLEAIPGLRTDLSPAELERQVSSVGCAVAAQSPNLVPADGALYALRDATATIDSVPLIAASVMSKKLAVGTDLILLDVKAGSGAFMKTVEAAEELARACIALADGWGRACRVAVTDMSQPLGDAVGNALDVAEAVSLLSGAFRGRLRALVVAFAAEALVRLQDVDRTDAEARAERALDSGEALERFRRMVEAQGGDPRVADDPARVLPHAPVVAPIRAARPGTLTGTDAEAIGRAAAALGAGRISKGDAIDPAVGLVLRAKIGDRVDVGDEIGEVHARTREDADGCARAVLDALTLGDEPVAPPPLVHAWVEGGGGRR
jgi:pyrimidine-nucleoside phosphorylase